MSKKTTTDVQFSVRVTNDVNDQIDLFMNKYHISKRAEFVRIAISEKLERERVLGEPAITYNQNSEDVMRMLSVMDNPLIKSKIKAIVAEG
ncbi:MAG: hypothetical protein Q4Q53_07210 [Methanocorpusculum sp.]|nr:hypothetical protein [Methanocorpusculum sp.]